MSAFEDPWGDIDKTENKTPYVVGSEGWGWMFIFLLLAIPFLIVGRYLYAFSTAICHYPIIAGSVYLGVSFLVGIIFYRKSDMKCRLCGWFASILTLLPLGLGIGFYAIPYLLIKGTFAGAFEWILVFACLFGISFFIFSLSSLLKNGFIHLVMASIYSLIVIVVLYRHLTGAGEFTFEQIKELYGLFNL